MVSSNRKVKVKLIKFVHLILISSILILSPKIYATDEHGGTAANLIFQLRDPGSSYEVRTAAAKRLAERGDVNAIPALVKILMSDIPETGTIQYAQMRHAAATALSDLKWTPPDAKSNARFLVVLERWDDAIHFGESVDELIEYRLKISSFWSVRGSTIAPLEALGSFRQRSAEPYLTRAFMSTPPDRYISIYGREILPAIAKSLEALDWNPTDRRAKARFLISLGHWKQVIELKEDAVPELISAMEFDGNYAARAAQALAKIGDNRAIKALVEQLGGWTAAEYSVKRALVHFGSAAVPHLITGIEKRKDSSHKYIAQVLGDIGDIQAIPALVNVLTEWDTGPYASSALSKLGWKPSSDTERIHFLVARRMKNELLENWGTTQKVLLADVTHGKDSSRSNALYAFIGFGRQDGITSLIEVLQEHGSKEIAEAYLNCGHKDLRAAAVDWANREGYAISKGAGRSPVRWGGM
jgi:HEAT repeat protein